MHHLLLMFTLISFVGLVVSLTKYCFLLVGWADPLGPFSRWLFPWMLVGVWMPAILAMGWLTKEQKGNWQVGLRGCPSWMRLLMYLFFGYAIFSYFFVKPIAPQQVLPPGGRPPEAVLGHTGMIMAFFAIATCIHYSAYRVISASRKEIGSE